MQILTEISQIIKRSEALGLSVSALCRLAGVEPSTLLRAKNANSHPSVRILRKITQALINREKSVQAHLVDVHGPLVCPQCGEPLQQNDDLEAAE